MISGVYNFINLDVAIWYGDVLNVGEIEGLKVNWVGFEIS